MAVITVISI